MKKFATSLVFFSLVCLSAGAQESDLPPAQRPAADGSAHQPRSRWTSATREEFAREYIIARAQDKAAARRDRIEGMRAMGFSPARPTVNAVPSMGHPPTWHVSNVWAYPFWNSYWSQSLYVVPNLSP